MSDNFQPNAIAINVRDDVESIAKAKTDLLMMGWGFLSIKPSRLPSMKTITVMPMCADQTKIDITRRKLEYTYGVK